MPWRFGSIGENNQVFSLRRRLIRRKAAGSSGGLFPCLQHIQNCLLGSGTLGLVDDLAVFHNHQRGDAGDTELGSQFRILVHVDLAHLDIRTLVSNFLHQGKHHPAGAASGSPEVQQNLLLRVDYLTMKIVGIDIDSCHIACLLVLYFVALL